MVLINYKIFENLNNFNKEERYQELFSLLPDDIQNKMKNTPQDKKHHAEGDVEKHTKMVFDKVIEKFGINDIEMQIAAIFHDMGKITTTKKINKNGEEKIVAYDHEKESLPFFEEYKHLYDDYIKNEERIKEVIKEHMRSHKYAEDEMSKKKQKKFEQHPYFKDIMKFEKCDEEGKK